MALTFSGTRVITPGVVFSCITGDDAYAVAGEAVLASDVGLTVIEAVFFGSQSGYSLSWSPSSQATAGKILAYVAGNATTSAATAVESSVRDLSGLTFTALFIGR